MTEPRVSDAAAREAAIDPERSFIVQAPAGSGKTGLLTQRFLRLLAGVDAPEEIVAITFTRKAAGEMRERIVTALERAQEAAEPSDPHAAVTWRLARAATERDRRLGWQLTRHPARLRVLTIDAFNAALTRQLPWTSGFGAPPAISDRATELYEAAARRTVAALESGEGWTDAIARFLLHVDNRPETAAQLLAGMLARRDQWLGHLLGTRAEDRAALEAAFAHEVRVHLRRVRAAVPAGLRDTLAGLAAGAAERLAAAGIDSPILACAGLDALPPAEPAALAQWQGLAELLLTRKGGWRRAVDRRVGFAPDAGGPKAQVQALLQRLDGQADALAGLLDAVRALPVPRYDDAQWQLLEALRQMLPMAVAELSVVFAERAEVDHVEVALRALQALGDDEAPTDLALALDHRIGHLLIDEFQDTSTGQFRLLEALTRGWTPGDGRSLFLVGDPMQSIYRFREAEVGLFLRARRDGVGQVALTPLRLTTNFRSRATLVDWVNEGFPGLLPPVEDAAAGAVPFEPSVAFDPAPDGAVGVHPMFGERADPVGEAAAVARLARERLAETDDGVVAILARGRAQVAAILPALRAAGLRCQSVEIESLATRPAVQDLLALTRALVHEGDRTAWLSVLRAPWCGLALADLHAIAAADPQRTLPECLADPESLSGVSGDGRARLARVLPVLHEALAQRRRGGLRPRVETAWLAIGGPAAAGDRASLEDARAFLALLEQHDEAGDLDDVNALDEAVAALYARPDPEGDPRLQVMTIHRSKGLEFDTVILPGLHAGQRGDDPPLLRWMERPRPGGPPGLLLAPVRPVGRSEPDPLYRFVQQLGQEKDAHEQGRLLYVAVTRAVRRLELFGFVRTKVDGSGAPELGRPAGGSLLARLWPVLEGAYAAALARQAAGDADPVPAPPAPEPALRRLPLDWRAPEPVAAVEWVGGVAEPEAADPDVEFDWARGEARLTGVVVHRFLQQVAEDGLAAWDAGRVAARRPALRAMLAGLGVAPDALDGAEAQAAAALTDALADGNGRWILGAHAEAASELKLAAAGERGPEVHVIDRCFVAEDGTRWVVDYKTGYRAGGDRDGFLLQEAGRYRAQLARYAALMRLREPQRPVRAALYYPLMQALVEVDTEHVPAGPSDTGADRPRDRILEGGA